MFWVFKKLLVSLNTHGLWKTLFWIYFSYLKVNRFLLYKKDLSEGIPKIENPNKVIIEKTSIQDLEHIRVSGRKLPMEFYCDVIEGANTCFIAFVHGAPAHIMWVYFGGDKSRFFKLGEKEAELCYAITLPEYKGLGIYPIMATSICNWLVENKYQKVFGSIHEENVAAIKSIERSGFKKIGEVKYYGIFSFFRRSLQRR
jgi:hypothetical protein